MESGEAAGSGGERDQARQWLLAHTDPQPHPSHPGCDALIDLGLVGQITHRTTDSDGKGQGVDTGATDAVAALTLLRYLREELAGWEPGLIAAARTGGASWVQLAPALGVASRQAAERRYLRLRPDDTGVAHTGEQRVQVERDRRAADRAVGRWTRQNATTLRTLGAQVSALDGDRDLTVTGQHHVDRVTAALGEADTTALLEPLRAMVAHLHTSHPALADKITTVADHSDQARRDSRA
ncbi:MAG TPA: HSP18 transcriptional regulator [Pseudonocardiaceae bacterium]